MRIRIVGLENVWWPIWYRITPNRGTIYHGTPRDRKIIVSMTSFPARINQVHLCVDSLLRQTMKPDSVILYLSQDQFPDHEIPVDLKRLQKKGLDIRFVQGDLRPHKKYFYAMQEFPEDIVITVDDDCYYDKDLIACLMNSYEQHPQAISCTRAHQITFTDGYVLPYVQWQDKVMISKEPSMILLPTGCGGVLYPPHSLAEDVFCEDIIRETCLSADDIWLRAMGILQGTAVVKVGGNRDGKFTPIRSMRYETLEYNNVSGGGNDVAIQRVFSRYGIEEILQKYVD